MSYRLKAALWSDPRNSEQGPRGEGAYAAETNAAFTLVGHVYTFVDKRFPGCNSIEASSCQRSSVFSDAGRIGAVIAHRLGPLRLGPGPDFLSPPAHPDTGRMNLLDAVQPPPRPLFQRGRNVA